MSCTIEPDLEHYDGTPSGSYILCLRCRPSPHEHPCPICLEDVPCADSCEHLTVGDELERPRSFHRVCEGCRPAVWPAPPEQLALPGVLTT